MNLFRVSGFKLMYYTEAYWRPSHPSIVETFGILSGEWGEVKFVKTVDMEICRLSLSLFRNNRSVAQRFSEKSLLLQKNLEGYPRVNHIVYFKNCRSLD